MIRAMLAGLVLAAAPASADPPRLELDAAVVWLGSGPRFGGFSGLEVLDRGRKFVTVADKGAWATGSMQREGGRLAGIETTGIGPLLAISEAPLTGDDTDAEDLALDGRGRFFVAFEGFHRIRRYDRIDGPATHVVGHPDFPRLQRNSGLEALAIDAEGRLFAIPERSGALARPYPVFRLAGGRWDRTLRIPREGSFLVAGADFGPDGRLYVLERDFTWLGGFATRVRRFVLGADGFGAGTTLLQTGFGELDNMEAISVWRDDDGRIRATLLSDDNFFPLQVTQFAEYVLVED